MSNYTNLMDELCYEDDNTIFGLYGNNHFLSNFYKCPIIYDGRQYMCAEAAYMSAKTNNQKDKQHLTKLNGPEAKKFGKTVELINNWDNIKYHKMYDVLFEKFNQNKSLRDKLLATGNKHIYEANYWNDKYWGCDKNKIGQNKLGEILMDLRTFFKLGVNTEMMSLFNNYHFAYKVINNHRSVAYNMFTIIHITNKVDHLLLEIFNEELVNDDYVSIKIFNQPDYKDRIIEFILPYVIDVKDEKNINSWLNNVRMTYYANTGNEYMNDEGAIEDLKNQNYMLNCYEYAKEEAFNFINLFG